MPTCETWDQSLWSAKLENNSKFPSIIEEYINKDEKILNWRGQNNDNII